MNIDDRILIFLEADLSCVGGQRRRPDKSVEAADQSGLYKGKIPGFVCQRSLETLTDW